MKLFFFLILFVQVGLLAQDAYIPKALNLQKKSYEFKLDGGLHASSTRVDLNGDEKSFTNGEGFSRAFSRLTASFGWTQEIQLSAGINLVNNSITVFDGSKTENISNAGVESFLARASYAFNSKNPKWLSQAYVQFTQSAYTNTPYNASEPNATIVLGDGGNELQIGYNTFYQLGGLGTGLEAGIAYNAPSELSSEILYHVSIVWSQNRWAFLGGFKGIRSLSNSEFSDDPAQQPQIYNGSTFLFNSINREIMSASVSAYYKWNSRLRLGASLEQDLSGQSIDLGTRALFSIGYRVDSLYREKREKVRFKNYGIEAAIEKISSQNNYVVINKGFIDGVQRGMKFDFFAYDFKGGNKLLARGIVLKTKSRESIIKIKTWFGSSKSLEGDVIARGDIGSL